MKLALLLVACAFVVGCFGASWQTNGVEWTMIGSVAMVDLNVGYAAGSQDGSGNFVLKTTNGGKSWENVNWNGTAMINYVALATSEKDAIVGGIGVFSAPETYTTDGLNFHPASDLALTVTSQDGSLLPLASGGNGYALVGQWDSTNGFAYSVDGVSWNHVNTTSVAWQSGSRYGSFPTPSTFYISTGYWPSTNSSVGMVTPSRYNEDGSRDDMVHRNTEVVRHLRYKSLTSKIHAALKAPSRPGAQPRMHSIKYGQLKPWEQQHRAFRTPIRGGDAPQWYGSVEKTTDGGNTWTTVFSSTNFYLNDICCPDADNCFGTAENDQGAWILSTHNGGSTWTQWYAGDNMSLMSCHFFNDQEGWIGGGIMGNPAFMGYAFYTSDGGKSWTANKVPDVYFNSFSFVDNAHGWAGIFDVMSQSQIATYN